MSGPPSSYSLSTSPPGKGRLVRRRQPPYTLVWTLFVVASTSPVGTCCHGVFPADLTLHIFRSSSSFKGLVRDMEGTHDRSEASRSTSRQCSSFLRADRLPRAVRTSPTSPFCAAPFVGLLTRRRGLHPLRPNRGPNPQRFYRLTYCCRHLPHPRHHHLGVVQVVVCWTCEQTWVVCVWCV